MSCDQLTRCAVEQFAYLLNKFALLLAEVDLGCPLAGSYLGHYSAAGPEADFFHLRTDYNVMNGGVRVKFCWFVESGISSWRMILLYEQLL